MTRALVLMKAMPPTHGHKNLIDFAAKVADEGTVLIDTADDEPMIKERVFALNLMLPVFQDWKVDHVWFNHHDPEDPVYWEVWDKFLEKYKGYDYVVASENYAKVVARKIGARYLPYDPTREMRDVRATNIRRDPFNNFKLIAPQFQPELRTTVGIIGAESTGKTTLSNRLNQMLPSHRIFEWARPYLETTKNDIDVDSMTDIWYGQRALEDQAYEWLNKPVLIKDTDLFLTLGYWEQPHWKDVLGTPPAELYKDAVCRKADLYLFTQANIPFEEDPIRYGGKERESSDEYWMSVADKYNLNYVVLQNSDLNKRVDEAYEIVMEAVDKKLSRIKYERPNNGS